ncbi:MAG TPA: M42 family metallopeptidase [Candidatus Cloacimonadota bacterium]|nr:M42 family metallopeptidase [Candidatus Cloacimonadota bacterium]HPS37982.1 M42 family metallopeptidase [Candidatus Cloacimonadota bacterium]
MDYCKFAVDHIVKLCRIPSPSGMTGKVRDFLVRELASLEFDPVMTNKGSVLACLGGEGDHLVLAAHIDTLGAMVRAIKPTGSIRFTKIGGYPENNIENENVIVHTRDGREYTGTVYINGPAAHVYHDSGSSKRDDSTMEVVLDEIVKCKEDTQKLGIAVGDFISLDARTILTPSGFIKSRHLDDKASAGILLGLAKLVKDGKLKLNRKVSILFTAYEEVGHGASAGVPLDAVEMISVDMGAVGDDLETDEYKVSICAKDSGGPYDYDVTTELIRIAKELKLQYAVDIYPFYGSDVEGTLRAGYDVKHGLIGPGVFASHGYERTHTQGVDNTLKLLRAYIGKKK